VGGVRYAINKSAMPNGIYITFVDHKNIILKLNFFFFNCFDRSRFFLSFITDTRLLSNLTIYSSNTTGTAYHSRAPGFTPGIWWVRVAHLFSFLCCFVFCLSSSCVLCAQCCQCFWIVHYGLQLRFSITFIFF